MAKAFDAVVKTGEYTNNQGENKGRYTNIGVVMNGDNGQYMLLEPGINLAGILIQQNQMAVAKGQQPRSNVMVSLYEPNQQGQAPQQPMPQPTQPQPMAQPQPMMQQPQPMQQQAPQQQMAGANAGFNNDPAPF